MLKKIFNKLKNNSLFTFMLGIMLCSCVVYGTSAYESNNIKYNPKISSFKQNLQEAKMVTLG